MKKIALLGVLTAAIAVCVCFTGCDEKKSGTYIVPTKPGGGGQQQPYLPAGNKGGGQYMHLDKK